MKRNLEDIQGSRFFGRRHGKVLSPARKGRMEHYLPLYRIEEARDNIHSVADYFAMEESSHDQGYRQYWLEIGFGKGEHLAWQAAHNRDVGIIGCEPFINGVSGLVDEIDERELSNVRIFMDDARLMMDSLPTEGLDRAFILFADPWPKFRHHKRRIVNEGNLRELARILKDGAELRIATDHLDYCHWIMAHMMRAAEFEWINDSVSDWAIRGDDWPQTRYEEKAGREGRLSRYMRFRRRERG